MRRLEWVCRLGSSYGKRRHPRVRLRKGRRGIFLVLGQRMTKRAAFRAARKMRDEQKERRPLVVWQTTPHKWVFGVRRQRSR